MVVGSMMKKKRPTRLLKPVKVQLKRQLMNTSAAPLLTPNDLPKIDYGAQCARYINDNGQVVDYCLENPENPRL